MDPAGACCRNHARAALGDPETTEYLAISIKYGVPGSLGGSRIIAVVPLGGVVESGVASLGARTSASRCCASAIATRRSVGFRVPDLSLPGVINDTSST